MPKQALPSENACSPLARRILHLWTGIWMAAAASCLCAGQVSVKENLRGASTGAPMPTSTNNSVKGQPKAQESSPMPSVSRGDTGGCGYFTKPLVRADGGGLHVHAEGNWICHNGTMWECSVGWQNRGPCSRYSQSFVAEAQACDVEGTGCNGASESPNTRNTSNTRQEDSPDEPPSGVNSPVSRDVGGGRYRGAATEGIGFSTGSGVLLGENPEDADLRRREAELQRKESQSRSAVRTSANEASRGNGPSGGGYLGEAKAPDHSSAPCATDASLEARISEIMERHRAKVSSLLSSGDTCRGTAALIDYQNQIISAIQTCTAPVTSAKIAAYRSEIAGNRNFLKARCSGY